MRFYYIGQHRSKPLSFARGWLLSGLLLLVINVMGSPVLALGESSDTKLQEGMFPWELVKAFGPPKSSLVMEARREVLWNYSWGSLKFFEGRLSSWNKVTGHSARATDPIQVENVPRPEIRGIRTKLPVNQTVDPRDILTAIAEEEGDTSKPNPQSIGGQQLRRAR